MTLYILNHPLPFQVNSYETRSEALTRDDGSPSYFSNEAQSDSIKALINAALQQQEASILAKMTKSEEGIRAEVLQVSSQIVTSEKKLKAELAYNHGHSQQLSAKIASLQVYLPFIFLAFFLHWLFSTSFKTCFNFQSELRRWKRRYMTCCRVSDPISSATFKDKLHDELKQLFSSPEGLVLLGAVAAHLTPVEKATTNIHHFNDTDMRSWISSTFLDRDDFERKMANMTKYFNEGN